MSTHVIKIDGKDFSSRIEAIQFFAKGKDLSKKESFEEIASKIPGITKYYVKQILTSKIKKEKKSSSKKSLVTIPAKTKMVKKLGRKSKPINKTLSKEIKVAMESIIQ